MSALAGDPYAQYCTPSLCGAGGGAWVGFGGTSVAAPSWGAAVLLSDEACSTKIGFLNPLLYKEAALLTGPIRSGNNDLDRHARRDVRGVRVRRLLDGRRPGLPRRRTN